MCPACIITIGGGLLLAKKLGVNDVLSIGVITVIFSILMDFLLRKINHGKAMFSYQKIIIPTVILLIIILIFKLKI